MLCFGLIRRFLLFLFFFSLLFLDVLFVPKGVNGGGKEFTFWIVDACSIR